MKKIGTFFADLFMAIFITIIIVLLCVLLILPVILLAIFELILKGKDHFLNKGGNQK